ncbi:MAG: 2-dehydropantoate 2-reductase, partial [Planctomycetaceae bacterium]
MSSSTAPFRYCIIGAGALGGLYGGMLANAGREVHFLLHSDYEHVRTHGLQVDSVRGNFHLAADALHVHQDAQTLPPCDVTIVGLKTTRNHLLAELLPQPTSGGGIVLCLQNGLHSEADSAAVVGAGRVLGGCCFLCCNKTGPGHIRHIDYGRIVMGEFTPAADPPAGITPRLAAIVEDMRAAGIDAHATPDLWMARWRKLMWNIPFNGLSVVLNASTRDLIDTPATESLAQSIMQEVYDAARACGRTLPADAIEATLDHTRQMVPYDSSMRLDYLAQRPMELAAIFAAP